MKSKENINMKKLIPILFITSIILSGCGSKKITQKYHKQKLIVHHQN